MGIPKLSQDLSGYTEEVVLGGPCIPGRHDPSEDRIRITQLVIDGPSLVYFVYNRLRRSHTGPEISYNTIHKGVTRLREDLEEQGVEIRKIFFDGGLPVSKRPTRLDRLEKHRKQLALYGQLHPDGVRYTRSSKLDHDGPVGIWAASLKESTAAVYPPAPPFMIAMAIDHLKNSFGRGIVEMVPGEADMYCAKFAQIHSVAILSSDSDMALYDLGPHGTVVLLQSIERIESDDTGPEIIASCFRPHSIAARLHISSLRVLAHERLLDSSVSSNIVKHRARVRDSSTAVDSHFESFTKQYDISGISLWDILPPVQDVSGGTEANPVESHSNPPDMIDPRFAELYCQLSAEEDSVLIDDELHMYLPCLFEDLTRDAAWSYGSSIRQMAYSMLHLGLQTRRRDGSIVEFYRSGDRICGSRLPLLSRAELSDFRVDLTHCVDSVRKTGLQGEHAMPNVLASRLFLMSLLNRQKYQVGKPAITQKQARQHLGLLDSEMLTWDSIHLNANLQALAYSLSLLQQSWALVNQLDTHESRILHLAPMIDSLGQIGTMKSQFMTHAERAAITAEKEGFGAEATRATEPSTVTAVIRAAEFNMIAPDLMVSVLDNEICKLLPAENAQANVYARTESKRTGTQKINHTRAGLQERRRQKDIPRANQNMFEILGRNE